MLTNADITLYHKGYNPQTRMEDWTREYYPAANVQRDIMTAITDNGVQYANAIKIRIPTDETIVIANEDKVIVGYCSDTSPPKEAHTVVGYADNRRGGAYMRHWKVVCK